MTTRRTTERNAARIVAGLLTPLGRVLPKGPDISGYAEAAELELDALEATFIAPGEGRAEEIIYFGICLAKVVRLAADRDAPNPRELELVNNLVSNALSTLDAIAEPAAEPVTA